MVNPNKFQFESIDHAKTIRYEVGFFPDAVSLTPVALTAYAPSTLTANGAAWIGDLTKPLFGMNLVIRVNAVGVSSGVEVVSGWSDPSSAFDFAPSKPTLVGVF